MKPYNFKGVIKDNLNQNRELYNLETTNGETNKAMPIASFGWVVALPTDGNSVVFTIENNGDSSNAICIGGVFDKSLTLDNDEYAYLPKDGKKIISIKNNGDIIINTNGKTNIISQGDVTLQSQGKIYITNSSDIDIKGSNIILDGQCSIGGGNYIPLTTEDVKNIIAPSGTTGGACTFIPPALVKNTKIS